MAAAAPIPEIAMLFGKDGNPHRVGNRTRFYTRISFGTFGAVFAQYDPTFKIQFTKFQFPAYYGVNWVQHARVIQIHYGGNSSGNVPAGQIVGQWLPATQQLALFDAKHGSATPAELAADTDLQNWVIDLECESGDILK